jgi:hypothetical protein
VVRLFAKDMVAVAVEVVPMESKKLEGKIHCSSNMWEVVVEVEQVFQQEKVEL